MRLLLSLVAAVVATSAAEPDSPGLRVARIVGLEYPRQAHMASVQGEVQFLLQIGEDGTVKSVEILSGNSLLAGPSVESLKKWRFTPCKGSGKECKYPISIEFVLKGGPVNISQTKKEFEFELPGRIIVRAQLAKAIVD